MRLGEWVAEQRDRIRRTAEWQAARDLLLRRAPRSSGGSGGALVGRRRIGVGGCSAAGARSSTGRRCAIQGPPGSGKTYTGARMIVDIVRAGRVVGITSNSHKVIGNLIEAVHQGACRKVQSIRIVQKGKKDEAFDHPSGQAGRRQR